MTPPLPPGRGINRATDLNSAGGCRRSATFVKAKHLVLPRKAGEFDEASARRRLIAHDVLIVHLQQHIRRQDRLPMLRETAKGQIVVRQLDLIVREQEHAAKQGFMDRPARVQWMSSDQYDLRPRKCRVNEPAIKIVLKCLVDETPVWRHPEYPD